MALDNAQINSDRKSGLKADKRVEIRELYNIFVGTNKTVPYIGLPVLSGSDRRAEFHCMLFI